MASPNAIVRWLRRSSALFLVALVACGDGDGTTADTTVADDTATLSDVDVAPDTVDIVEVDDTADVSRDVGPTAFDVTVTVGGAPLADAAVVFHDAQGAVLSEAVTDASGVASGMIPTDGMVTTLYERYASERFLVTLTHLDPLTGGAAVDYPAGLARSVPVAPSTLTVTAPALEEQALFRVGNFCEQVYGWDPAALDALPVFDGCVTAAGTQEVFAFAQSGGLNPEPLAYQLVEDVAGDATAAQVASWRTDFSTLAVEVTSAAPFDDQVAVRVGVAPAAAMPGASDQVDLADTTLFDPVGVRTASFPVPDGMRGRLRLAVIGRSRATASVGERSSARAELLPAEEAAPSLRVGGDESDLLPLIDALSGDFTTPARPAVDWSASLTADWCAAEIAWQPAAGGHDQWLLVLPSDATGRAQWPELPASQAALTPTGARLQAMTCRDWSTIDGYRDYLARGPVDYFSYGGVPSPARATTRVSTASPAE
ncbi:MAG: hypothetical protein EP329_21210 [Deltaproteobacteria bacterium]|nr:MAG: hypothetical protein EP329_21210 [Deltaproteobacteria bacterium]